MIQVTKSKQQNPAKAPENDLRDLKLPPPGVQLESAQPRNRDTSTEPPESVPQSQMQQTAPRKRQPDGQ